MGVHCDFSSFIHDFISLGTFTFKLSTLSCVFLHLLTPKQGDWPRTPPLPMPLLRFWDLGVCHVLSLSNFSHSFSLLSPLFLFTIFYIPQMDETRCLSFSDWLNFAKHNTLFHPRWSKWWVFVVSNAWVILHCIYRPHLLYPFFNGHWGSFHSWLLWPLLLETLGCRCPAVSLHQYLWGKSPAVQLLGRSVAHFQTGDILGCFPFECAWKQNLPPCCRSLMPPANSLHAPPLGALI